MGRYNQPGKQKRRYIKRNRSRQTTSKYIENERASL